MTDYSRVHDFVAGTPAVADEVDSEFNAIVTAVASKVDKTGTAQVPELAMATGVSGLAKGSFSAYRNSALSISSGAVVVFDSEEWDVSSWFDVGTGRFTPQVAGYYRLSARLTPASVLTADKFWGLVLQKNGAGVKGLGFVPQRGTAAPVAHGSAIVVANGSSDYFDLYASHDQGGSVAISTGAANAYFQGELVGRS